MFYLVELYNLAEVYADSQIMAILKQVDAEAPVPDLCREHGMSSASFYEWHAKHANKNDVIADWLIRLTTAQRNWGFWLCFLYLRNIKGFKWNHKRVYRIYHALELNLRIKPRKLLVRERPAPLGTATDINKIWSIDFMHDQLADGRDI